MTHVAAALSLAGTAGCCTCLVYLHLATTGYSPVRDPVSAYGVGAYARWYQAQTTCAGIAGILLAVALKHPSHVVALLVVFGLARFAITQFPMDTRRVPHYLLAVIAFGTVTSAAIRLHYALGWAMLAALGVTVVARRAQLGFFGLAERVFYVAMLAWLVLVAIQLL